MCVTDVIEGDVSNQLPTFAPYLPWAVWFCTISIPVFMWCYYSKLSRGVVGRIPRLKPSGQRFYLAATLICGLSVFMLYELAHGDLLSFLLLGYNATSEMYGRGYLAAGFTWLFVGTMFILAKYSVQRKKRDLVLFYVLLVPQLAMFFVLGNRHDALFIVTVVILFYHFAIERIKFSRLVLVALVGFLALNVVGTMRQSDYEDYGDFVNKSINAALKAKGDAFFYTLTTGEFVAPFETFPQVIRKFGSDEVPCQWGWTFLRAPIYFVPQAIYSDRPPVLTHWYMETFYGNHEGQNIGRQFFFLAEGYLNFGPIGVFLVAAFWGLFLGAVHRWRAQNSKNWAVSLVYALTIAFLMKCVGGDFNNFAVGLPEQVLLIALVGIWITGRKNPTPA